LYRIVQLSKWREKSSAADGARMQRPIMNPTFFEAGDAAPAPRPRPLLRMARILLRLMRAFTRLLFMDPVARLRHRGLKIEDGTTASRIVRGIMYRMAFIPILLALTIALVVYTATHPPQVPSDFDPTSAGIYYDEVTFRTSDGVRLSGWLVPVLDAQRVLRERDELLRQRSPAVVLVHDYASRRQQMLPLVRPLHEAGFVVMVVSLRGCGTSQPTAQTFGLREALDVKAAVETLRRRSFVDPSKIALVGVGTGATAAIIAAAEDPAVVAVVADSPMPDADAVLTRYVGPQQELLRWMRPLCRWAFEIGFHLDADQLRLANYDELLQSERALLIDGEHRQAALASSAVGEQLIAFIQERTKPASPAATAKIE
jgi:pimeloyl-ACP methyl ester carboxylesterase